MRLPKGLVLVLLAAALMAAFEPSLAGVDHPWNEEADFGGSYGASGGSSLPVVLAFIGAVAMGIVGLFKTSTGQQLAVFVAAGFFGGLLIGLPVSCAQKSVGAPASAAPYKQETELPSASHEASPPADPYGYETVDSVIKVIGQPKYISPLRNCNEGGRQEPYMCRYLMWDLPNGSGASLLATEDGAIYRIGRWPVEAIKKEASKNR